MTSLSGPGARTGTAILLFSLGIFFFAVNDALGKWLIGSYPVGQLLFLRTVGAAVFLVPLLIRQPHPLRVAGPIHLHILRVLIMAFDTSAFYFATRSLPLADVMTFYLAGPLFITALAGIWLGERIRPLQGLALAVGFGGVLMALQPSGQTFTPAAVLALAGSLMFATSIVITRRLRQTHWLSLISWQIIGAGLVGALASTVVWVTPTLLDAGLMALVGLTSMLCFISINQALKLASASTLAPFQYMSIVWAILLGWLVWGDLPQPHMWLGIMLIVASGGVVWLNERARGPSVDASTV
jgi:S-adenosylmethionine uptake transporter